MDGEEILLEGDSLDDARRRVTEGHCLVREEVLSDGSPRRAAGGGPTPEDALRQARGLVPDEAEILDEQLVAEPGDVSFTVEAFTESDARTRAESSIRPGDIVTGVALQTEGSKGFLGIGRRPAVYKAAVRQVAHAEVTFRTRARIRGLVVTLEALGVLLREAETIERDVRQYLKILRGVPAGLRNPVLESVRFSFERQRFNAALERARAWWPGDEGLLALAPLATSSFRSADDTVAQVTLAQNAASKLLLLIRPHLAAVGGHGGGQDEAAPADVPSCPRGHGPLREWSGKLRCWECGYPDK